MSKYIIFGSGQKVILKLIFTYDIRPSLIIDLKILSCIAHWFGKGTWQPFFTSFQNANFLSSPCTSACCNRGTITRPNYYHIIMRTKFIVIRRKSWKLRAILQNDVELIRKRLYCHLYILISFLFCCELMYDRPYLRISATLNHELIQLMMYRNRTIRTYFILEFLNVNIFC